MGSYLHPDKQAEMVQKTKVKLAIKLRLGFQNNLKVRLHFWWIDGLVGDWVWVCGCVDRCVDENRSRIPPKLSNIFIFNGTITYIDRVPYFH